MKPKIFALVTVICCLLCGVVACEPDNPAVDDDGKLTIYDCSFDSGYDLLVNSDAVAEFEVPVYSNKQLEFDDLILLDTEGENIDNVIIYVMSVSYGELPQAYSAGFVENVVTVAVEAPDEFEGEVKLTSLTFAYKALDVTCDVNVSVAYTDFDTEAAGLTTDDIDIAYESGEIEAFTFLWEPTSDVLIKDYSLLGGDWLKITRSKWVGKESEVELKEPPYEHLFESATFGSIDVSFYFEYKTKPASPWYNDYLIIGIETDGAEYSLALKVRSFAAPDEYYKGISDEIEALK